ncbi:MAG TPA: SIS domain-containing protein, partial [Streptosporangiaceae bacterium]
NPAKALALELFGTLPLIWGTSPLAGVAAYRFSCQLNENGKYPAVAGLLPEANHNQVVAFDGPFAPGADGGLSQGFADDETASPAANGKEPAVALRLVLLRDSHEHPQVARRREESARLAAERGIGVSELAAVGEGPLERLASLVQLIDYATVYLAIAYGTDPGPVAAIQELKARISSDR